MRSFPTITDTSILETVQQLSLVIMGYNTVFTIKKKITNRVSAYLNRASSWAFMIDNDQGLKLSKSSDVELVDDLLLIVRTISVFFFSTTAVVEWRAHRFP